MCAITIKLSRATRTDTGRPSSVLLDPATRLHSAADEALQNAEQPKAAGAVSDRNRSSAHPIARGLEASPEILGNGRAQACVLILNLQVLHRIAAQAPNS